MNFPSDLSELTSLFEKYGAKEPESWASSQLNEGIPQLQRFLFLRQAWRHVVRDDDAEWIQRQVESARQDPDGPYAGVGHALARCIEKGVPAADIADIVRGMQAQFLFHLCYLLDDPQFPEKALRDFSWGLFEVDKDGKPVPPRIGDLYESVLETDPTGREVRPRKAV
jgi:hypothetical protein